MSNVAHTHTRSRARKHTQSETVFLQRNVLAFSEKHHCLLLSFEAGIVKSCCEVREPSVLSQWTGTGLQINHFSGQN